MKGDSTPKDEASEEKNVPFAVQLSAEATVKAGIVSVEGQSNLPTGAVLMVSLTKGEFSAQAKVETYAGTFSVASLSDKGGPLSAGDYLLRITLPASQNTTVSAVIGARGKNLIGPQVKESYGARIATFEKTVQVGGVEAMKAGQTKEAADAAFMAELKSLYSELMEFKGGERFLEFGFSSQGFPDWKTSAEALREKPCSRQDAKTCSIVLLQLGLKYAFTKGQEEEFTTDARRRIEACLNAP